MQVKIVNMQSTQAGFIYFIFTKLRHKGRITATACSKYCLDMFILVREETPEYSEKDPRSSALTTNFHIVVSRRGGWLGLAEQLPNNKILKGMHNILIMPNRNLHRNSKNLGKFPQIVRALPRSSTTGIQLTWNITPELISVVRGTACYPCFTQKKNYLRCYKREKSYLKTSLYTLK